MFPETTYNTWFAPIVPLKYEDKTLILQIPSQFFYEILEERFVDLIRKTLYKVIGEGTKLMYNVMVDKTSIPNQTVNLEASNRSTAVTPKKYNRRKQSSQLLTGSCRSRFGPAFESQL